MRMLMVFRTFNVQMCTFRDMTAAGFQKMLGKMTFRHMRQRTEPDADAGNFAGSFGAGKFDDFFHETGHL